MSTEPPPPQSPPPAPVQPRAPKASTSKAPPHPSRSLPRHLIREGDKVLIRLPSTVVKAIKINHTATISLGKYGSFKAAALIGRPYGDTYEIKEDGLQVMQATLNEIEETAANNENISATGAQKLTFVDIAALRSEGMSGRDIIAKQVEEHSAFELKTEYSKEKYMKRKEAKYLQIFTPIEPTVHNIAEYNFEKQAPKVRDLRPDTLSQMMTYANVRPGGKLLVVEDIHGMVVAGAVERMGGDGRILIINDCDSPPDLHLLDSFNFDPSYLAPITSIHWAATEPSWQLPDLPLQVDETTVKSSKSSREQVKVNRRRATFDKTKDARDEFLAGGFDGVIIACEYDPYSILQRLLPSIGGSAPIVIFSPYLQVLHDTNLLLRASPSFLAPSLIEPWLRKYQVLPGRCHPEMNGMPPGGYILVCTRVFDSGEVHSVLSGRRAAKRRKVEDAEGGFEEGEGGQ